MPQSLAEGIASLPADWRFILSPYSGRKLKGISIEKVQRVILLIGPEGGFSTKEMELADYNGFLPLKLGPRILRTETAAVAAITALQCLFGDIG